MCNSLPWDIMRMSYKEKPVRNSKAAHVRSSKLLCTQPGQVEFRWVSPLFPWLSRWKLCKLSQNIHLVTFTKCVFINIRGEGPSRLHPAHRCSGVHDVDVTSPAPTGPHLTFTIFCLETAWRSVPVEADCPDPCLCTASRCIHNSYWFPPTDFIIHSHIVPSPVDKSSSFPMDLCRRITQVLPDPAG